MGDLLKVGSRTQLIAKVFDVRTGQRVRTVRQDALNADSIMPAFGLLARGVLALEPPGGTALGAIGTTRLDAYQRYLDGVHALNAFDLPTAHASFDRALQLDSSFALAHYKLALVIGWESGAGAEHLRHAQAASRLAAGLPARERSLIAGMVLQAQNEYGRACDIYQPMVRADSNDVEALYNYGECTFHDAVVVPSATDSTVGAFRSSWNVSLRAFQRVLALDPTYHLAFQHIQDALLATVRPGCLPASGTTTCQATNGGWGGAVQREGDSLRTVPVNFFVNPSSFESQNLQARTSAARRRNLEVARAAALDWLQSGMTEMRPRIAYGRILLRLGRVAAADSVFHTVSGRRARTEQGAFVADRAEAAIKLGRPEEGERLFDSLTAELDSIPGIRGQLALVGGLFGKVRGVDEFVRGNVQVPPPIRQFFILEARVLMGAPAESLLAVEQVFTRMIAGSQGSARALTLTMPTLVWTDFATRGGQWPLPGDTASADPRLRLVSVFATGDTARYRAAIARFDAATDALSDEADNGTGLLGANAHLLVGDTAGALVRLRRFRDVTWPRSPLLEQMGTGFALSGWVWGRTMLLLGDLAAARGQADEARAAYRFVLGLWAHADPEFQPTVERVRAALARLGG
jgi:hypothetical protein